MICAAIGLQAAVVVLRHDAERRLDGAPVGQHIGLGADLDQRVGVLPGHGEDAARPAVFEGAREDPLIVGGERGGDGVAGEARGHRGPRR